MLLQEASCIQCIAVLYIYCDDDEHKYVKRLCKPIITIPVHCTISVSVFTAIFIFLVFAREKYMIKNNYQKAYIVRMWALQHHWILGYVDVQCGWLVERGANQTSAMAVHTEKLPKSICFLCVCDQHWNLLGLWKTIRAGSAGMFWTTVVCRVRKVWATREREMW